MSESGSLTTAVTIELDAPTAFDRFTLAMSRWWPSDYTWSQGALQSIQIDPRPGGFCTELGPHGFRSDFGRVLEVEAGKRIVFTWQISLQRVPQPDPSCASEVEVQFEPIRAKTTKVTLEHRHFDRHGEGAEAYREQMASEYGWPLLLAAFTQPTT